MRQHLLLQDYRISIPNLRSGDEDTDSETEEVAGVEEFDSSSSAFRDDEPDSPAQAAQPNHGAQQRCPRICSRI